MSTTLISSKGNKMTLKRILPTVARVPWNNVILFSSFFVQWTGIEMIPFRWTHLVYVSPRSITIKRHVLHFILQYIATPIMITAQQTLSEEQWLYSMNMIHIDVSLLRLGFSHFVPCGLVLSTVKCDSDVSRNARFFNN